MARDDERSAKPKHYGNGESAEKLAHGMGETLATCHPVGEIVKPLSVTMETAAHLMLGIESLDDTEASEGFLDIAHQHTPLGLKLERTTL